MAEDEERLLERREFYKHAEKIENSKIRDRMARIKIDGYNKLAVKDDPLVKIFWGYASTLHPDSGKVILDALVECISTKNYNERLSCILQNRITPLADILDILTHSS